MKLFNIFIVFILISNSATSQWILNPPTAFGSDTVFVGNMYFYDQLNGFLVGGRRALAEGLVLKIATYKTNDGCKSWSRLQDFAPMGMSGIAGKGRDTIIIGVGDSGVIKTTDNGLSWRKIFPIAGSPHLTDDGALFLHTLSGLYLSTDYGETFSKQSDKVIHPSNSFLKVFNKFSLYYFDAIEKRVYKSSDGGKSFQSRTRISADHGFDNYLYHFISDSLLIAIVKNEVYRSIDGGQSWQVISSVLNPAFNYNNLLFINEKDGFFSSSGYVYKTNDTGRTWCLHEVNGSPFNFMSIGGPMHFINDSIGFWPNGGGSRGSVIMTTTNQGGPPCPSDTTIKGLGAELGFNQLKVFPNPSAGLLTLSLEQGQLSQVQLFSMEGRLVFTQKLSEQEVTLQLPAMSPGIYMLEVQSTANKIFRQKLVIE